MKSYSEYLAWLIDLLEKSNDVKTKKSIQKLTSLIINLEKQKVFDKDASKILRRLEILAQNIEAEPLKIKYFVNSCSGAIINISAKFYRLILKNHYLNEWTANGMSFGTIIGVIIFASTGNAAYLGLGIGIGLAIGSGIGNLLDNKTVREGRIINLE